MKRKDTIDSLFLNKPGAAPAPTPAPAAENASPRVRTGAISSMGVKLQEMADGVKTAARLQDQLASGDRVVELAPSLIDGSSIADRMVLDNDPAFEDLVRSVDEHGQQVPILVRPHPEKSGRFQVVYGRRRLRAAARLGRSVRTIVRTMGDEDLIIAQGRENLDRADLSFIEIAFFARRLEDAGIDRSVITAALASDKGSVSRYISIARAIPENIAMNIGPAAKAGRARWLALSEALKKAKTVSKIETLTKTDAFMAANSDARFAMALRAASPETKKPERRTLAWRSGEGLAAAKIEQGADETKLTFGDASGAAFGAFIAQQLDALYAQFKKENE
ncbi:plasmid partitioning protein RepB [Ancylobacter sonchi]|uniref:plasmid partitioning protein RepB n=1 Tax=Ancylobacter sonchi TaxID=1937790 RepID=UPI001BD36FA4|nr:plasmid partitioning protein RepB [Ancylobacter sonchi]MBS7532319.1 plasmid partitioning protein RepB [Ancylobacter sonchi]